MYRYKLFKKIKPGSIIIKTSFAFFPTRLADNTIIFWKHYTQQHRWTNDMSRDYNWIRIPNTKERK